MKEGTKGLRIASVLELVFGVVSIIMIQVLMKNGDASAANLSGGSSLMWLVFGYVAAGFQILAGIVGLACANKKSLLTIIFGIILYIPVLWHFFQIKGNISLILLNVVTLIVPYVYSRSAFLNFKNK